MLPRLALGFAGVLAAAIGIAACSSSDATQSIAVGPSFGPETLYAANVTQNSVNIYKPFPSTTTGPLYQIGGSSTSLSGPQYLAFDASYNLWTTNWLSSTSSGAIIEFLPQATGNVVPWQSLSLGTIRPRGIATLRYSFYGAATASNVLAVAVTDPSQPTSFNSGIALYEGPLLSSGQFARIAGPATGLNVPSGIAVDAKNNVYVANLQGASVEVFAIPTATPSPSPTASPTVTPSPTATPTGATPTPATTATPTPLNLAPIATISGGATGLNEPTGLGLDTNGNIYVTDQKATTCSCPAVLIFAAGSSGAVAPKVISGTKTGLLAPTDVKVDSSGNIFVADELNGTGVIYEFAPNSSGNVAPTAIIGSPGSVIGLGLLP
jgi:hypothetical protein